MAMKHKSSVNIFEWLYLVQQISMYSLVSLSTAALPPLHVAIEILRAIRDISVDAAYKAFQTVRNASSAAFHAVWDVLTRLASWAYEAMSAAVKWAKQKVGSAAKFAAAYARMRIAAIWNAFLSAASGFFSWFVDMSPLPQFIKDRLKDASDPQQPLAGMQSIDFYIHLGPNTDPKSLQRRVDDASKADGLLTLQYVIKCKPPAASGGWWSSSAGDSKEPSWWQKRLGAPGPFHAFEGDPRSLHHAGSAVGKDTCPETWSAWDTTAFEDAILAEYMDDSVLQWDWE